MSSDCGDCYECETLAAYGLWNRKGLEENMSSEFEARCLLSEDEIELTINDTSTGDADYITRLGKAQHRKTLATVVSEYFHWSGVAQYSYLYHVNVGTFESDRQAMWADSMGKVLYLAADHLRRLGELT